MTANRTENGDHGKTHKWKMKRENDKASHQQMGKLTIRQTNKQAEIISKPSIEQIVCVIL